MTMLMMLLKVIQFTWRLHSEFFFNYAVTFLTQKANIKRPTLIRIPLLIWESTLQSDTPTLNDEIFSSTQSNDSNILRIWCSGDVAVSQSLQRGCFLLLSPRSRHVRLSAAQPHQHRRRLSRCYAPTWVRGERGAPPRGA
jgi:hypothetical protein